MHDTPVTRNAWKRPLTSRNAKKLRRSSRRDSAIWVVLGVACALVAFLLMSPWPLLGTVACYAVAEVLGLLGAIRERLDLLIELQRDRQTGRRSKNPDGAIPTVTAEPVPPVRPKRR